MCLWNFWPFFLTCWLMIFPNCSGSLCCWWRTQKCSNPPHSFIWWRQVFHLLGLLLPGDLCTPWGHLRQFCRGWSRADSSITHPWMSEVESTGTLPPLTEIIHSKGVDHKRVHLLDTAMSGDFLMTLRKLRISFPQKNKVLHSMVSAYLEEKICHQYSAHHLCSLSAKMAIYTGRKN